MVLSVSGSVFTISVFTVLVPAVAASPVTVALSPAENVLGLFGAPAIPVTGR